MGHERSWMPSMKAITLPVGYSLQLYAIVNDGLLYLANDPAHWGLERRGGLSLSFCLVTIQPD